ncbi:unnamed protein product [Natator depressus]
MSPPREVTCYLASLALLVLVLACREGTEEQHDSLGKLCGREFIRPIVASCGGSRWKFCSRSPGQEPGKVGAKQLSWLDCDRFSPGPEAAEGPGSPEGARHPVLVAALGPQENPGAAFLPWRVERDIGPAGMCCTRGCTRKEMMPFS